MDWLLTRETVILLAVSGAIPSIAASVLQGSGKLTAGRARQLNIAGYVLMTASMILFIIVGFNS